MRILLVNWQDRENPQAGSVYNERIRRRALESEHPLVSVVAPVLDEAEKGVRLVVMGRRSSNRVLGFPFGSVTRAVLHYSTVPVLVVPTTED